MCYIDFIYSNIYYFIAILLILSYVLYSSRQYIKNTYHYVKTYYNTQNENHATDGNLDVLN